MTDIVYFLTPDQFYQHQELRYSLRSLEKHVAGAGQVFVVGAEPAWTCRGLVHIPECDPYERNRDANIIRKMRITCQEPEISDPFLFVNDDHFFSQDCRAGEFPYYHKGEIRNLTGARDYARRLANTRKLLAAQGLPTLNYDVHTPILVHKEKFLGVFDALDWVDLNGPGVVMKSVYGNSRPEIAAAGVYLPDCKLTRRTGGQVDFWLGKMADRPCWSSGNYVPRLVWELLERLYPEPSIYEKEPPQCP